jgi:hypothetical protein
MKNQSLNAMNFEANRNIFGMCFPLVVSALVAVLNLAFATTTSAAVTVASYWRIGEFDPGASPGTTAPTAMDTSVGAHHLKIMGPAYYSNDVAIAALTHVSSFLSLNFASGAFASNNGPRRFYSVRSP